MKVATCSIVLIALFALSKGEECQDAGDCHHVTCPDSGYRLECHNRQCTCSQTGSTCSVAGDCHGNNCQRDWHCVDGTCRCGFGFGGGGGGVGK